MAGGGRTVVAKSSRSKAARTYVFVKVNAGKTCSEMESSEIFFFFLLFRLLRWKKPRRLGSGALRRRNEDQLRN